VHDGSYQGHSDLQLSELKGDRELDQIAGRESPAAPTSLRILAVRHDDAFLAQVDQAVLRLAEESGCLRERPNVGFLLHPDRDRLS